MREIRAMPVALVVAEPAVLAEIIIIFLTVLTIEDTLLLALAGDLVAVEIAALGHPAHLVIRVARAMQGARLLV